MKNRERKFVMTKRNKCNGNIVSGFSTLPSIYRSGVPVHLSGANGVWYSSVLCLICLISRHTYVKGKLLFFSKNVLGEDNMLLTVSLVFVFLNRP